MSLFTAVAAIFGAFIFLVWVIGIGLYILMAYGLYRLARNRSIAYEWLAFIPIAQLYILGKLIKNLNLFGYDVPYVELVLPVAALVVAVLGRIPFLGFLLSLALLVVLYVAIYRLYIIYKGVEDAKTMLIISIVSIILGGFMVPVYIFSIRELKPQLP